MCLDLPMHAYAYHLLFDFPFAASTWCFCGVCVCLVFARFAYADLGRDGHLGNLSGINGLIGYISDDFTSFVYICHISFGVDRKMWTWGYAAMTVLEKDRSRTVLTPRERGGPRAFLCLAVSHQVMLDERDGQPCDKKPLKYKILKLP